MTGLRLSAPMKLWLAALAACIVIVALSRAWRSPDAAALAAFHPTSKANPISALPLDSAEVRDIPDSVRTDINEALRAMPLLFHENHGEHPEEVRFATRGNGRAVFFTTSGVTYSLRGGLTETPDGTTDRWTLQLDFVNANEATTLSGRHAAETKFHDFRGPESQWRTGDIAFEGLTYRELWPGIDLLVGGRTNEIKHKYLVEPGVDPSVIKLRYSGATDIRVREASDDPGGLDIETPVTTLQDSSPVAFQDIDGETIAIPARYRILEADPAAGTWICDFELLGDYDPSLPLVIDPVTYVACGFIGGIDDDAGFGVTFDDEGNYYIAGSTASPMTFPAVVGPDLEYNGGNADAFVAMLPPDGSALTFCTFIGGTKIDRATCVAIDKYGDLYVGGWTWSYRWFPVTQGAADRTHNGKTDGFIMKLRPDGALIRYSTLFGGREHDIVRAIVIDDLQNAIIAGGTDSHRFDLPNVYLTGTPGYFDAFVARLNWSGTVFDRTHLVTGALDDQAYGVASLPGDDVVIVGRTLSSQTTFPVTLGPDLVFDGNPDDGFVARVSFGSHALRWCGYIGGEESDCAKAVSIDVDGHVHVTGVTFSSERFPVIVGPDLTYNGSGDAFVACVYNNGRGFLHAGYVGGARYDEGNGIAVDAMRRAYLVGSTKSDEQTFPVRDAAQPTFQGERDGFLSLVAADGGGLLMSTFFGGEAADRIDAVAVAPFGDIYMTGSTESTETTFPVVGGPDPTHNGAVDAFATRVRYDDGLEWTCRTGRVDLANQTLPANVVKVNGQSGAGVERVVSLALGESLSITIDAPPAGPTPADFALYGYLAAPTYESVNLQPYGLGDFCFGTFLSGGLPKPNFIWNNLGFEGQLGEADFPSDPAPTEVLLRNAGIRQPIVFTLQGFIRDLGSTADGPVSITNAVEVRVE